MGITRYRPIETFSKVADSTDASAEYVEFDVPYTPVGLIAQVFSVTTGAVNSTGLAVTQSTGKVKVAVTALALGDTVSLICFE